jgi:2-amino-4-hydroxy-6-hydroxymethyldihydropteridine diphosphokinase
VTATPAFVSGGSNLSPAENLVHAARELKRRFPGARFSRCWRNASVGFEGPDFINFVAELPVAIGPAALRDELQQIERLCGRAADAPRWAPRSMDLDILLFGDRVMNEPGLVLPRPDLLRWGFMLGPLAEIAPDRVHPVRKVSVRELWADFDQNANPLHSVDLDLNAA